MPSIFNRRAAACIECKSNPLCEKTALKVLGALKGRGLPIDTVLQQFEYAFAQSRPMGLAESQVKTLATAPIKIAGRLERLFLQGFDQTALRKLHAGVNPFSVAGAKHLHLLGYLLLEGGFTQSELRARCCESLGWTASTASVEVSQALSLVRLLGLIQETGDHISIRR